MGCRDADGLEELGRETKTVPGGLEELPVFCNLIWAMLVLYSETGNTETNIV
jgi:hypothetical protein